MTEAVLPSTRTGSIFIVSSLAFFFLASYATLFSAFLPPPGNLVRSTPLQRTHSSRCLDLRSDVEFCYRFLTCWREIHITSTSPF